MSMCFNIIIFLHSNIFILATNPCFARIGCSCCIWDRFWEKKIIQSKDKNIRSSDRFFISNSTRSD